MRYLLEPFIRLTGYRKLPFAVHDLRRSRTEFLDREQFSLVYRLDGKHEIDRAALSEHELAFLDHLLSGGFVHECEEGKTLRPYQEYRYYDNRFRDSVHWSVTGRCNYRCKHCFMSAPEAKFGHPTKEQCLGLIEQMEECGIGNVTITGGEPLIRGDLPELVSALTAHRIRISAILTNGALVDDTLLDMLEENGQHPSFQMSFDGKGMHDWMRGVDGAEEAVLNAFRLLARRGFSTSSAMAMHRGNAGLLRDSILQLRDVGCGSLKINVAYPTGEWVNHPEHFLTQEEGWQTYLDYIPQYFADGAPIGLMLESAFTYDPGRDHYGIAADRDGGDRFGKAPVCGAMRSMIYVGPEGVVLPCQSMIAAPIFDRYPNVFETPLREILNDSVYADDVCSFVSDYMAHNPECAACEYARHCCGGCRAIGVGPGGTDFFAPDMRACGFYKNGWYERFKAVAEEELAKFRASGGPERCRERMKGRPAAPISDGC